MSVISETLTGLRLRKNMEREQLAYELGISVSAITKFETAYAEPDEETILKLADYFGVTPSYITGGTGKSVGISEPIIGRIKGQCHYVPVMRAGTAAKAIVRESEIIDRVVFQYDLQKGSDILAILLEDDFQRCGRARKGDTVFVEVTNALSNGDIAAVSHDGEDVFFRKYLRKGKFVTLSSDRGYPDITYIAGDKKYKIIGKVICFQGFPI